MKSRFFPKYTFFPLMNSKISLLTRRAYWKQKTGPQCNENPIKSKSAIRAVGSIKPDSATVYTHLNVNYLHYLHITVPGKTTGYKDSMGFYPLRVKNSEL